MCAWGSRPEGGGIDDLIASVREGRAEAVCVLPMRSFGDDEAHKLARAFVESGSTGVREIVVSGRHMLSSDAIEALGRAARVARVSRVSIGGARSFGNDGLFALCAGLEGSESERGNGSDGFLVELDLESRGLQGADAGARLSAALRIVMATTECALKLADNPNLGDAGCVALARAGLKPLSRLDLRGCTCGDEGAVALADALYNDAQESQRLSSATSMPLLRELDVGGDGTPGTGITKAGAAALARALVAGATIEKLSLSGNAEIGCAGLRAIAETIGGSPLQSLDVRGIGAGEDGAFHLADGLRNTPSHLVELDIGENRIGDAASVRVFEAATAAGVRRLGLFGVALGDEAVEAMVRTVSPSLAIEELDLGGNGISSQGANMLLDALVKDSQLMPALRHLVLGGNPATGGGADTNGIEAHVKALEDVRPGTRIAWRV